MRTHQQLEASRRNGALSEGPVTPEGKARSAANTPAHGLAAKTIVLTNECQPRFQALLDSFIAQFAPANESEFCCVEEMALARWRLRRAAGYETALLDYQIESGQPFDAENHGRLDQTTRGALAWSALHETSFSFHNLSRYESAHRRSCRRALADLLTLKKLKTPNEPNTPRHEDPLTSPEAEAIS